MSSPVQVEGGRRTWHLSFLEASSLDTVLQLVQSHGIVRVRGTGEVNPKWPDVLENKFVKTFLDSYDRFIASSGGAKSIPSDCVLTLGRAANWKQLAGESDIKTLVCYFLGGDRDQNWRVGYDATLKGEATSHVALVDANGGDIIIYNGWLRISNPSPVGREGSVVVVHFTDEPSKAT